MALKENSDLTGPKSGAARRWGPAAVALAGLAALAWSAAEAGGEGGVRLALSAMIGFVGGAALYHAAFGFTGAWRRLQREKRGAGVRAQALLVALVVLVSFPLIAYGGYGAWVQPVGLRAAIGAAMFGFGMQLGGGCGSGTLFTVGGGSSRMALTLAAFVAGSLIYTGSWWLWKDLPELGRFSLIGRLGVWPAMLLTLALLGAVAYAARVVETRTHGALEQGRATGSMWRGPWSLTLGAATLALVVIACFLVLNRPWGITSAYPIWGAKVADAVGLSVRDWSYWRYQQGKIDGSVFSDATSVMNFGIILGALCAAGLAGAFKPQSRLGFRDVWTAVLGGFLMGYGARLAYGCNVGGFVGGVVSGSAHGWSWLLFGALGSVAGVWLRARVGMDPPVKVQAAAGG